MRLQTLRFQIFLIGMLYTAGVNAELYAAVQKVVKTGDLPEAVAWPLVVYRRVKGLVSG